MANVRTKRITILLLSFLFILGPTLIGCSGSRKRVKRNLLKKTYKKVKRRPKKGFFSWPVKGRLASRFGKRRGRRHDGIDIAAAKGTKIRAAAKGKVIFSGWMRGYGKIIIIKHKKNFVTVYAHNQKNYVSKGKRVKKGTLIARVGKTGRASGYHLHFEIRSGTTPINPLTYLPRRKKSKRKIRKRRPKKKGCCLIPCLF